MAAPSKTARPSSREPQGVQGVEIGLRLATSLAQAMGPLTLGELAQATGLHPSKTHRYLVSLCRAGLLEQDGKNGRYDLGPAALTLGLAAQGRLDKFRLVDAALEELHALTQSTVSAAVWGSHGPTIIDRRESLRAVTVNTRIGSVLPVTTSAAGRLYAAYLPRETIQPFVDADVALGLPLRHMDKPVKRAEFFTVLIEEIRRHGLSRVRGDHLVGIDAIAAPVFDQRGDLAMSITVLGPQGAFDLALDGLHALAIKGVAERLSKRLGFGAAPRPGGVALQEPKKAGR